MNNRENAFQEFIYIQDLFQVLFTLLSNFQNTEPQEVVSVLKDIINTLIHYQIRRHHEGMYHCLPLNLHLTVLWSFYLCTDVCDLQ